MVSSWPCRFKFLGVDRFGFKADIMKHLWLALRVIFWTVYHNIIAKKTNIWIIFLVCFCHYIFAEYRCKLCLKFRSFVRKFITVYCWISLFMHCNIRFPHFICLWIAMQIIKVYFGMSIWFISRKTFLARKIRLSNIRAFRLDNFLRLWYKGFCLNINDILSLYMMTIDWGLINKLMGVVFWLINYLILKLFVDCGLMSVLWNLVIGDRLLQKTSIWVYFIYFLLLDHWFLHF